MEKVVFFKNGDSKHARLSVRKVIEANKKVFDELAKR